MRVRFSFQQGVSVKMEGWRWEGKVDVVDEEEELVDGGGGGGRDGQEEETRRTALTTGEKDGEEKSRRGAEEKGTGRCGPSGKCRH